MPTPELRSRRKIKLWLSLSLRIDFDILLNSPPSVSFQLLYSSLVRFKYEIIFQVYSFFFWLCGATMTVHVLQHTYTVGMANGSRRNIYVLKDPAAKERSLR